MKRLGCCTLAVIVLSCAGCGGRTAISPLDREAAHRANNMGIAGLEQFKYPEAASAFRQALALDSTLGIAHLNLSLALLYSQDLAQAAAEATEASRLLPAAPQPPYVLGLIARAGNRNDDALRLFERVRQIDGDDVGTRVNIGQIQLDERSFSDAIATLRAAVAGEPYNVTAAYALGLALTRSGAREEGQRTLDASQALGREGYAVTFGSGYLEQGRLAEAMAATGAEPGLVDAMPPSASFSPSAITTPPRPGGATPSLPMPPAVAAGLPFGRRFSAADLDAGGARRLAAMLGGGVTLLDFDGDDDLDLLAASADQQQLFRNDGGEGWRDVTATSGIARRPADAVPIGCMAGDYDNDGMIDLFVLAYGGNRLYHNDGSGRFRDVTAAARLPPYPFLPGAAAFVDVDHDGDLDIVIAGLADIAASRARAGRGAMVFPTDFVGAPLQLLRNNGNATWSDVTLDARLQGLAHAVAIVPTDFDNRRDIDLLIVNRGLPSMLFQNLRDGTFRDVAETTGLVAAIGSNDDVSAVAVGDVNKDDFADFFVARARGGSMVRSDGRGRFTAAEAPMTSGAMAVQFIDYDNDGLPDLFAWSAGGPRLYRNLGQRWGDVSDRALAVPATTLPALPDSPRSVALGDLDGDGNTDVVTGARGQAVVWHNSGDATRRALRVRLKGRVGNRAAIGSTVQVRAGSLYARVETSSATPAAGPADVVFGLGSRGGADVVRVLWPSGILQAETAAGTATLASPLSIEELDRKPSSCPFLFAWNGDRFEFITDFMGGGEMGYWERPGVHNTADPVEYVRIRGDQLLAKEGRFELRITNELEEALFADRFQLVAIAHPPQVGVFPNEGLAEPPKPPALFGVENQRAPRSVVDDLGHDVSDEVARIDRRYPDRFALAPFRGYAASHTLTIDLGAGSGEPQPSALLLTGWTDYAFSSDNRAAYQAGLALSAPALEIREVSGRWRSAILQIGIPVGRPQTIVVDLRSHLRAGEHEVRIVTNMRIYWDQILAGRLVDTSRLRQVHLDPHAATLRARGFSQVIRPDGKEPEAYNYDRVSEVSPWKSMPGRYTREGDVVSLLTTTDDMFAVAAAGDELTLSFDASGAGPLPAGWTRTFLLVADGFSKEMDINSASPDVVGPLPFHAMTRYPYAGSERPDTPAHREYRATYNTRVVRRSLPWLSTQGGQGSGTSH